jgi:hypothetical protein
VTTNAALARLEADLGELVAKRARSGGDRRNFRRYARDPVGFSRRVLGDAPWSRQREIMEAVRDHPLVVVRSCNSAGKDWTAARIACWWVYAVGGRVLLLGPTARQVEEILMRKEIARAFAAGRLPGEVYATALRRSRGGEADILAMTSTEVGKLTGFHGERVLVIITEAQDVEDFAFEAAIANATGAADRILAVGNPLRPLGRFWTISQPGSAWRSIAIRADEHPNVVEGRDVIPGGVTAAWVERVRAEYGVGSPQYVARVLGEFPTEASDALIKRAWLEQAVTLYESGALANGAATSRWSAGVDVAGSENGDQSCLALRRGPVLFGLSLWREPDTMKSAGTVAASLRARGLRPRPRESGVDGLPAADPLAPGWDDGLPPSDVSVRVDIVGLGKGLADRLGELGWPVRKLHGAAKPRAQDGRFLNVRAEMYWHLRELLERGRIALPRDEALFAELLQTRWALVDSSGKIKIEAKDDIRARLGRSPDRADALVYAFADGGTSGGGVMVDF